MSLRASDFARGLSRRGSGGFGKIFSIDEDKIIKVVEFDKISDKRAFDKEVEFGVMASEHKFGPKIYASASTTSLGWVIIEKYDMTLMTFFDLYADTSTHWAQLLYNRLDRMLKAGLTCFDLKPHNVMVNVRETPKEAKITHLTLIDYDGRFCGQPATVSLRTLMLVFYYNSKRFVPSLVLEPWRLKIKRLLTRAPLDKPKMTQTLAELKRAGTVKHYFKRDVTAQDIQDDFI